MVGSILKRLASCRNSDSFLYILLVGLLHLQQLDLQVGPQRPVLGAQRVLRQQQPGQLVERIIKAAEELLGTAHQLAGGGEQVVGPAPRTW